MVLKYQQIDQVIPDYSGLARHQRKSSATFIESSQHENV